MWGCAACVAAGRGTAQPIFRPEAWDCRLLRGYLGMPQHPYPTLWTGRRGAIPPPAQNNRQGRCQKPRRKMPLVPLKRRSAVPAPGRSKPAPDPHSDTGGRPAPCPAHTLPASLGGSLKVAWRLGSTRSKSPSIGVGAARTHHLYLRGGVAYGVPTRTTAGAATSAPSPCRLPSAGVRGRVHRHTQRWVLAHQRRLDRGTAVAVCYAGEEQTASSSSAVVVASRRAASAASGCRLRVVR